MKILVDNADLKEIKKFMRYIRWMGSLAILPF